jgi:hypothetical protein
MTISNRLLAALLCLAPLLAWAQSDTIPRLQEVTNTQMLGFGASEVLDTYLSPEKYSGPELRYISHTVRQRTGSPWRRYLIHEGNVSTNEDRSGDGTTLAALYDFRYAVHRSWQLAGGRLQLEAGGMINPGLGVLNNTRNTNNPAQAKARLNIGPSVAAAFRFPLFRRQAVVRYEAYAPLLGVMFSPNYGQSYYEIFTRGNYDHNVVPTTVGCAPVLRHQLTLDIALRRFALRVGYMGDMQQASVNNLKYHSYSHLFLIGFVRSLYRK